MNFRETTIPKGFEPLVLARHPLENQNHLERGFLLAYFILPERSKALRILTSALNKLKSQMKQERKRAYWRDKFLKRRITRVTRDDEDTLQWLIYLESCSCENTQEALGQITTEDMVVRYVKTLIQFSAWMSSFYVNLAVHRLLYCYTTAETQAIYEFVTDHYREADEYRRAKRLLMQRLESRFVGTLRIIKGDRGETIFRQDENQEIWNDTILNCLRMFTPWSTQAHCPFRQDRASAPKRFRTMLSGNCEKSNDQDKIEVNRSHAFIDPICSGYAVGQLGFEQHSSKLGIPLFHMNADHNTSPPPPRTPRSPLTLQEKHSIASTLSAEEARRKNVTPSEIRFVVDDSECASLYLDKKRDLRFVAPFGAELLEVWTRDEQGPLLLATHPLADNMREQKTNFYLPFGSKGTISLSVLKPADETSGSTILVSAGSIQNAFLWSLVRSWLANMRPTPAYVAMILLCASFAFIWTSMRRQLRGELSNENKLKAELARQGSSANSYKLGSVTVSYSLTPDDLITRSASDTKERFIDVPSVPVVINFELPVTRKDGQYSAALMPHESNETILSETRLSPTVHGDQANVIFAVPSNLLNSNQYYWIQLQSRRSLELRTFSFYTTTQKP